MYHGKPNRTITKQVVELLRVQLMEENQKSMPIVSRILVMLVFILSHATVFILLSLGLGEDTLHMM